MYLIYFKELEVGKNYACQLQKSELCYLAKSKYPC